MKRITCILMSMLLALTMLAPINAHAASSLTDAEKAKNAYNALLKNGNYKKSTGTTCNVLCLEWAFKSDGSDYLRLPYLNKDSVPELVLGKTDSEGNITSYYFFTCKSGKAVYLGKLSAKKGYNEGAELYFTSKKNKMVLMSEHLDFGDSNFDFDDDLGLLKMAYQLKHSYYLQKFSISDGTIKKGTTSEYQYYPGEEGLYQNINGDKSLFTTASLNGQNITSVSYTATTPLQSFETTAYVNGKAYTQLINFPEGALCKDFGTLVDEDPDLDETFYCDGVQINQRKYTLETEKYVDIDTLAYDELDAYEDVLDSDKITTANINTYCPVKASSFSVNKSKVTVKKGKTFKITCKLTPSTTNNKNFTYKSSNSKVASVSSKGVIKGVKKGTATITVTSKSNTKLKKTVKVTVK